MNRCKSCIHYVASVQLAGNTWTNTLCMQHAMILTDVKITSCNNFKQDPFRPVWMSEILPEELFDI